MATARDDLSTPSRSNWWVRLHRRPWYVRLPLKWAAFALVLVAVTFPYPDLLVRQLRHLSNPNALLDPNAAGLDQLIRELRPQLDPQADAAATLATVQRFVVKRIPYAWDWDTWGVADYMPTVGEALRAGREDCDGRAVIAGSLLLKLGFQARLVADGAHVWVWTPSGETMGPHAIKTIQATPQGFIIDWRGLAIIPKSIAFGIAVFPLSRELIVIAALWVLLWGPRLARFRITAAAAMLMLSLGLIRYGGRSFYDPAYWALAIGMVLLLGAIAICMIRCRRDDRPMSTVDAPSPTTAIDPPTIPQK